MDKIISLLMVFWLATLTSCKPIMVTFGTNQGGITPRQLEPDKLQPRSIVARSPAPVKEEREDTPNPYVYQPLVPHQYRSNIYAVRPPPNLILGTPLDQKYTPSIQKYNLHRKQYARNLGVDYRGPHTFEQQDYENAQPRKTKLYSSVQYDKDLKTQGNNKMVPQIGIIYSAGVRYYVPQIIYYEQQKPHGENGEQENSVYDQGDEKYYHYNKRQQ